jgi:hypothetical protein
MQLTFVVRNNDLTIDAILSTDSEASDMGTGLARLKRRMDYARFVADLLLAGIVSRKPKLRSLASINVHRTQYFTRPYRRTVADVILDV